MTAFPLRAAALVLAIGACAQRGGPAASSRAAEQPTPSNAVGSVDGEPPAQRDAQIASAIERITADELRIDLNAIAKPRHHEAAPRQLAATAAFIAASLRNAGCSVTRQPVRYGSAKADNVIGDRPGTSDAVVIVSAHYDAVAQTPGADDDASGVAAMLAVARALAPLKTEASLRFVAFAFEEEGLVGSVAYVRALAPEAKKKIVGVIQLEMIGFFSARRGSQQWAPGLRWLVERDILRDKADFIGLLGRADELPPYDALIAARAYVPGLDVETLAVPPYVLPLAPDLLRSDHVPFWLAGVPAVLVGDTAQMRNPNYHLPSDTVSTLDLGFMTEVTRWIAAGMLVMARNPDGRK